MNYATYIYTNKFLRACGSSNEASGWGEEPPYTHTGSALANHTPFRLTTKIIQIRPPTLPKGE